MTPHSADLPREDDFEQTISSLTARFVHSWHNTPAVLPATMREYSRSRQTFNEARILKVMHDPHRRKELKDLFNIPGHVAGSTLRRLAILNLFTESGDAEVFSTPSEQFAETTSEFVRQARGFDPQLSSAQMAQALRNLWVFNSFQYLADHKISVTPSALAYSLLYPYTDNYLDDRRVSSPKKREFGSRLGAELRDAGQKPLNNRESKIFSLIGMIGSEYPRKDFPLVHRSLQAIHSAQSRSLAQHEEMPWECVLPISFEKGGTSVLVDAFLAGAVPDNVWLEMAFGYGCVLQLVDDLQDTEKDSRQNHRTLFSACSYPSSFEVESLRLIRYLHDVVSSWPLLRGAGDTSFNSMITESCCVLILEAISRMHTSFSPQILQNLDLHAPVALNFLAGLRDRVQN